MWNTTSEIVMQIVFTTVARIQNTFNDDNENKILISDGQNHLVHSFSRFSFSLFLSFSFPIDCVYRCLPVHMYASMHIFSFYVLSFRQIAYDILYCMYAM